MDSYRYIEADDYYDMAMGWLKGRNRQKAEECLLKTLDLNPCFIHAYIDLAGLYARTDRYKDAVHVLKKATQHDPSFDRLHYLWRNTAGAGITSTRDLHRQGDRPNPTTSTFLKTR